MMDLVDAAWRKQLADAQRKAAYAPKGTKRAREWTLKRLMAAHLQRELREGKPLQNATARV